MDPVFLSILSFLGDIVEGAACTSIIDTSKKVMKELKTNDAEKGYLKEYENEIRKYENNIGTDRLAFTPKVKAYAMGQMIIETMTLTLLPKGDASEKLREQIIKHLAAESDYTELPSKNSNFYKQADEFIDRYCTIADRILPEIDPHRSIFQHVVAARAEIVQAFHIIFSQTKFIISQQKLLIDYTEEIRDRIPAPKDIVAPLYNALCNTRDSHPSYIFMGNDRDSLLSPGTDKLFYHDAYGTVTKSESPKPVWDLIRESWEKNYNQNIVLEGNAGIGKTVTLLSATFIDEVKNKRPAIYIPTRDLIDGDRPLTMEEYLSTIPYNKEINELALHSWNDFGGPSLLLLIDGFNEIPSPLQSKVLKQIKRWHQFREGVQLIFVARPTDGPRIGYNLSGETIVIKLKPIPIEDVKQYILSRFPNHDLPDKRSVIWEHLVYPLYLTIYLKTEQLKKLSVSGFALKLILGDGPNALLWNYLQRESCRDQTPEWLIQATITYEYILPRIAWEMLKQSSYEILRDDAELIVSKAVSLFSTKLSNYNHLPSHLRDVLNQYRIAQSQRPNLSEINWEQVVFGECGLLSSRTKSDTILCSFIHPTFRDCLAGSHLLNQVFLNENSIPAIWKSSVSPSVIDSIAELIDEPVANHLWNCNLREQQYDPCQNVTDRGTTSFLLELWRRNGLPKRLDFSGMDLRGYSISRYCQYFDDREPLFSSPMLSRGTLLDEATLSSYGHTNTVSCLSILPNGNLISGSNDHTIIVWNSNTGEALYVLRGHKSEVTNVIAIDNNTLVSGSYSGELLLWNLDDCNNPVLLGQHAKAVTCLALHKDGYVLSGSDDNSIRVWDTNEINNPPRPYRVYDQHLGAITSISVLDDGRFISSSADKSIRIWDLSIKSRQQCRHAFIDHNYPITCMSVLDNHRLISGGQNGELYVWDLTDFSRAPSCLSGNLNGFTSITTMENDRIACGSDDGFIYVWDLIDAKEPHLPIAKTKRIGSVTTTAAIPNSNIIISCSSTGPLQAWKIGESRKPYNIGNDEMPVSCIVILQDGYFACGYLDGSIQILNVYSDTPLLNLKSNKIQAMHVAKMNEEKIVCAISENTLCVRDLSDLHKVILYNCNVGALHSISTLNDRYVIVGGIRGKIGVWDMNSATKKVRFIRHHIRELSIISCIVPIDDERIICGDEHSTLCVLAPLTSSPLQTSNSATYCGSIKGIIVFDSANYLSCSSQALLALKSGRRKINIQNDRDIRHPLELNCITISNKNKRTVICGSNDGYLRKWGANWRRKAEKVSERKTGPITSVTTLSDGRVISGSEDGYIHLWDLNKKKSCPQRIDKFSAPITNILLFKNNRLVICTDDNLLHIVDLNKRQRIDLRYIGVDVSAYDFSQSHLSEDDAQLFWLNGATIPANLETTVSNNLWIDCLDHTSYYQ